MYGSAFIDLQSRFIDFKMHYTFDINIKYVLHYTVRCGFMASFYGKQLVQQRRRAWDK